MAPTPTRRQLLQAAGLTVGLSGTLSTQSKATAQSPSEPMAETPNLEHVYIKITTSGDLECLLITQEKLDEQSQDQQAIKQQVINSLSAIDPETATEVQAESHSIEPGFFYEQYTLAERDITPEEVRDKLNQQSSEEEPIADPELERLKELNETQSIPRPANQFVQAVIPDVAVVPAEENRFLGRPTVCPRITYDGGFLDPADPLTENSQVVTIQFHDGFVYELPRNQSSFRYPFDARYDIGETISGTPVVHGIGTDFRDDLRTIRFNVTPKISGEIFDPKVISLRFTHRAHPALAALRSLAVRQAILFTSLGQQVNENIVTPTEALNRVGGASIDAATSVGGIFFTLPPTSSDVGSVAKSLFFSAGPLIIAGVGVAVGSPIVAPLAATAVRTLGTANSFVSAAFSLRELGDTLEEVTEDIAGLAIQALARDTQCPEKPERQNDRACKIDLKSPPFLSTPIAVGQLGLFEQFYAPKSLTRAGTLVQLEMQAKQYRSLTREYEDQADLIKDELERVDSSLEVEVQTFKGVVSELLGSDSIAAQQRQLISSLEESFGIPAVILETPETIVAGNLVTLDATESELYDGGLSVDYNWEVTKTTDETNTTIATGFGDQLNITFPEPGTYQVTLEVSPSRTAQARFEFVSDTTNRQITTLTVESDTVTVGGQEVPIEFTSETASGERTVTADNAVEAINTFIAGDVSADVAVNVINAFIAS